jgi:hypothetical protein
MAIDRVNGPPGLPPPSFGSDAGRGEASTDDATRFRQLLEQRRGPDAEASHGERQAVAKNLGLLNASPAADAEADDMVKRARDTNIMAMIKDGFVRDGVRENGNEIQRMEREMQKKSR